MIRGKRVKVKGLNGEELNVLPAEAPILEAMKANQKKAEKSGYDTKEEKAAPDNKQAAAPEPPNDRVIKEGKIPEKPKSHKKPGPKPKK